MGLGKTKALVLASIAAYPGMDAEGIAEFTDLNKNSVTSTINELQRKNCLIKDVKTGLLERPDVEPKKLNGDKKLPYAVTGKGKRLIREKFNDVLSMIVTLERGANGYQYAPEHAREEKVS